jgi:hypothetical protein
MSAIISVRIEDDLKEEIKKAGYKPSEFIKKILIQELEREKSKKALAWLKKNKLKRGKTSVENQIRADRDGR